MWLRHEPVRTVFIGCYGADQRVKRASSTGLLGDEEARREPEVMKECTPRAITLGAAVQCDCAPIRLGLGWGGELWKGIGLLFLDNVQISARGSGRDWPM